MKKQDYEHRLYINDQEVIISDILKLEKKGIADIKRLPFSIKILVENLLRKLDGRIVTKEDLVNIARWRKNYDEPVEIPYHPARVLMQDFTGVPAVVDLAAMRDAVKELGGDPMKINPLVPVELVVDHSVQVDYFGTKGSLKKNVIKEYDRNKERYQLLKWAQKSFDNFRVVPPNSGICHQVNLEYFGKVMMTEEMNGDTIVYPDTLVGTDSHTTMINGIGVMGWGVGGIEAEAVMLGQPYYMSIPEVIGVKLIGELNEGVTATDLVLTLTELLRKQNVVEKFVEYFGSGMKNLSVPVRSTIANMTPEYGATMGFFPVDEKTIEYLELTGRGAHSELVEKCARSMDLFYTGKEETIYSQVLEFDLSTVVPSISGPLRPQDRIILEDVKKKMDAVFAQASLKKKNCTFDLNGKAVELSDGGIVIAAITSCTNTSNPHVLMGAGLLAMNAVKRGLKVPDYVKTSFAPGSKVVVRYLEDAGLMKYFKALGFHLVAFGCTTCIGNSGPLNHEIEKAVVDNDLNVASVLSGNRNFEARIHQRIKSNYLASPMLVVAFAMAGRIDIDFDKEPIGVDHDGNSVFLREILPKDAQIARFVQEHVKKEFFDVEYTRIFEGDEFWKSLTVNESTTFAWDKKSTYIRKPPFFHHFSRTIDKPMDVEDSKVLLLLGDSLTTDHISPAGAIPVDYPAGKYLTANNVLPENFNSYGSRRGNHEVMMRGTFGNIRLRNRLVSPKEGSFTKKYPENKQMFIYDATMGYMKEKKQLIVIGGREYGTGSSRDWAAKGTHLLGIKVVIARSFERIHRSNLVGMGVLPVVFKDDMTFEDLDLNGTESVFITGINNMRPRKVLKVKVVNEEGSDINFEVVSRLDTDIDVEYFENGGILQYVLRKMLTET